MISMAVAGWVMWCAFSLVVGIWGCGVLAASAFVAKLSSQVPIQMVVVGATVLLFAGYSGYHAYLNTPFHIVAN